MAAAVTTERAKTKTDDEYEQDTMINEIKVEV
jgi:hypothetical protein